MEVERVEFVIQPSKPYRWMSKNNDRAIGGSITRSADGGRRGGNGGIGRGESHHKQGV